MPKAQSKRLVVCIDNDGYAASLERRKIYVTLRDPIAEKRGLLRVVDESGDDYLYPKMFFPLDRVAAGAQESGVGGCLMTSKRSTSGAVRAKPGTSMRRRMRSRRRWSRVWR
jgi:hypothetical protein